MRGFVPTPRVIVDRMVDLLFQRVPPNAHSTVLDPGCGTGALIEGVVRWCKRRGTELPRITGIELDPRHISAARSRFAPYPNVILLQQNFLKTKPAEYDYVIGNPPYVPITSLTEAEKSFYRTRFLTAVERFDLYLLFFEQALKALKTNARLVFITPEKFLYVNTASPLRRLLAAREVDEISLIKEDAFENLITYPTITALLNKNQKSFTRIALRDGREVEVTLSKDGASWLPLIQTQHIPKGYVRLEEICVRISCGVATGADLVFVRNADSIDKTLRKFAYPTIAGRELIFDNDALPSRHCMLVPYRRDGHLLREVELGPLKAYLNQPDRRAKLLDRTCVRHKPWYSFHENPPLADILRPKILCKDIAPEPRFWIDSKGNLLPRHSVYYIVPKNPPILSRLNTYLNSDYARSWLVANCQHASNGYLRLQSHVLKKLPVPGEFARLTQSCERPNWQGDPSHTIDEHEGVGENL